MTSNLLDVFDSCGLFSFRFPNYAPRASQIELASIIERTMQEGEHLLAEAPTGVGKSVAYLVPSIFRAVDADRRANAFADRETAAEIRAKGRVVVATANIALQEQIVRKDLPLLQEVLPEPFRFALLKGRQNYLCLDRLRNGSPHSLHPDDAQMSLAITEWGERTETGDVSELSFEPSARLWSRFSVSSDDCHGESCGSFSLCHAERAARRAEDAHVIVTNDHLLFAHFRVLEETGGRGRVLPPYGALVLDEGHRVTDVARDFFGDRVTIGSLRWFGDLLSESDFRTRFSSACEVYFSELLAHRRSSAYRVRLRLPFAVDPNPILSVVSEAAQLYEKDVADASDWLKYVSFERSEEKTKKIEQRLRQLNKRIRRAEIVSRTIREAALLVDQSSVYYVEEDGGGRAVLVMKPIFVAERLREHIFRPGFPVVVTSATLTNGGSFDHIAGDLGVPSPQMFTVESSFSFSEQALLVLPNDLPEPNDASFSAAASRITAEAVRAARGRTLCLFTSWKALRVARTTIEATGYRVLCQGDAPRARLLKEFQEDISSVLLGVESFSAGVDVPGEALSCLVIDRLPFATPEDPILDAIQERDPNCFWNYSLPKAVIALKQGFGRLIRSRSDRGVCVLLDRRVETKSYGKVFLRSLPAGMRTSRRIEDVGLFLDGRL